MRNSGGRKIAAMFGMALQPRQQILVNGTTQVGETLSSYSRVLRSLQHNSKSGGELEKVVVGLNKGLADERKVLGSQQSSLPNLPTEYHVFSSPAQ